MLEANLLPEWVKKIDQFIERWPESPYGPAHIVIDDYNVSDGHIQFCLTRLAHYDPLDYASEHKPDELAATKELLEWLLTFSEDERLDLWATS